MRLRRRSLAPVTAEKDVVFTPRTAPPHRLSRNSTDVCQISIRNRGSILYMVCLVGNNQQCDPLDIFFYFFRRRAVEPGSVGRQVFVVTAEDEQVLVEKLVASSERGPSNNAPGSPQQLCMVCSQVITLCAPMTRFVAEVRPYTCSLTQSASSKT